MIVQKKNDIYNNTMLLRLQAFSVLTQTKRLIFKHSNKSRTIINYRLTHFLNRLNQFKK